jgi:hypothetical protein
MMEMMVMVMVMVMRWGRGEVEDEVGKTMVGQDVFEKRRGQKRPCLSRDAACSEPRAAPAAAAEQSR